MKLDGVRAFWDGTQFLSRTGHRYAAPKWFTAGLPLEPLDGELWLSRRQFQRTVSIVRRQDGGELWREVRFVMFDAPGHHGGFEERLRLVKTVVKTNRPPHAIAHPNVRCSGAAHLHTELARVLALGGEGLMLRQPDALYVAGRSRTLLKVKSFQDAEASVVGHEPGRGRHKGRLGALLVELPNGVRFAVGTGFQDAQRERPPQVGSVIRFRYQELTDDGVPRFPIYRRIHADVPNTTITNPFQKGENLMAVTSSKRRFEFVEGTSNKFWEVLVNGQKVVVRFGRIGSSGQSETKSFADPAAALRHADKKVAEKLNKGYVEVG